MIESPLIDPIKYSVNKIAKIAGILYLLIIVVGVFAELSRGKLVVSGDATATANNIMASQLKWRLGIWADLFMHLCDIPLMLIFYFLLKPVHKNLALLAMLFTLIQTAVMVSTKLNLFMPIFLSSNADYLKAFEPGQLNALMYLSIKSDGFGFGIGLLFFGFTCIVNGFLIIRSSYLPKTLGVMLQIAGLCYLVNSFALILGPEFEKIISPAILLPCFVGELSLCLWLLIKGVNTAKWNKQVN
ncbi:MAG: DUF4386 domain-containing protein [Ginsengibacter sp.]